MENAHGGSSLDSIIKARAPFIFKLYLSKNEASYEKTFSYTFDVFFQDESPSPRIVPSIVQNYYFTTRLNLLTNFPTIIHFDIYILLHISYTI